MPIQIDEIRVRDLDPDTLIAHYIIRWHLTDSPLIINTDELDESVHDGPPDVFAFTNWPLGATFT